MQRRGEVCNGGYIVAIGTKIILAEKIKGGIQCDPSNFVISGEPVQLEKPILLKPELSSQSDYLYREAGADSTISITSSTGEVLNFTALNNTKYVITSSSLF